MIPKIGIVSLACEYEIGFDKTSKLLNEVKVQLDEKDFNIIIAEEVIYNSETVIKAVTTLNHKDIDILCVCVGTWSEDHHLLDLMGYFDIPVILWAFPAVDTGSLCGALQICCVLKELGRQYYFAYGQPDDKKVLKEILEISMAAALKNRLKHIRIGSIGGRIKGMTEIAFDEFELKDKTGVRIVNIDDDELNEAFRKTNKNDAGKYWNELKVKMGEITSADNHGIESIRYYFALKELINIYKLEGIAIKCYPNLMGKVCLGYSLLSDEGIVCGCEGDVNNTVSMKILYELTGIPTHNTDLLYPDIENNTVLFSHCGSGAFSIAKRREDVHLGPVRLADTGVCSLFSAKPGKVTLMNLVGRRGTLRMTTLVGDAIPCGMEFPGNPLKVKFSKDILQIIKEIATEGIGHHWIGAYGDVSRELEEFCKLKGIRFIKL